MKWIMNFVSELQGSSPGIDAEALLSSSSEEASAALHETESHPLRTWRRARRSAISPSDLVGHARIRGSDEGCRHSAYALSFACGVQHPRRKARAARAKLGKHERLRSMLRARLARRCCAGVFFALSRSRFPVAALAACVFGMCSGEGMYGFCDDRGGHAGCPSARAKDDTPSAPSRG
jgi:hypothetical protein